MREQAFLSLRDGYNYFGTHPKTVTAFFRQAYCVNGRVRKEATGEVLA